jgi:hypothetical protein
MSLHLEILRPQAAALFEVLGRSPELEGLTLIGGTALALQIGHRISLDFDFATFGDALPTGRIERLIGRLKAQGHTAQLITSPDAISRFKINTGRRLLDYVRDYVIDGVKVTFFAHGKNEPQRAFYRATPKVQEPGVGFDLLGLEGQKVAKTLVLADRVRARDLYDLMILVRDHGYTVAQMVEVVRTLGTVDDPEAYKAILRGEIPLDEDDEGLEPVAVDAGPDALYAFFDAAIAAYEVDTARRFFSGES